MSFTLPPAYSNATKQGNIAENFVTQLYHPDTYLTFDGTDDHVDLGATTSSSAMALTSTTKMSIAFWVNFPVLGSTEFIFSNNSSANYAGVSVYKDSSDKISWLMGENTGTSSSDRETMYADTALSANTWYFIVIVTDFTTATRSGGNLIYINNSSATVANSGSAGITNPVYTSGNAYIGRRHSTYGQFKLKNFALWGTELNSDNITAIYNSGNIMSLAYDSGNYNQSSNLKGYWECNQGNNVIQDTTGYSSTGSITGAIYEDYLPLALADTTVDDVFYPGVITQKPIIRSSLDLSKSTAKTGNVSLSVVNYNYKGDDFSAELLLGSNKYINRNVKIYSQLNANSSLSNCFQVYNGRLIDISHDESMIKLTLTEQRPWDFITFPRDKTSAKNIYIPVVYGDFTANTSALNSPSYCYARLYPTPVLDFHRDYWYTLMPRSYTAGSNSHINIHQGGDIFLPLSNAAGSSISDATVEYENANALRTPTSRYASGYVTATEFDDTVVIGARMTDSYKAFNNSGLGGDTSVFATTAISGVTPVFIGANSTSSTFTGNAAASNYVAKLKVTHEYSETATINVLLGMSTDYQFGTVDIDVDFSADTETTTTFDIMSTLGTQNISEGIMLKYTKSSGNDGTLKIKDIQLHVATDFDGNNKDDEREMSKIKYFYSGGDGYVNSWDSSAISYGHEAHRDMLIRYAGYTTTAPENWIELNDDRSIATWKMRWWTLEPVELKKILEKVQYEFGFIFKFRPDGTGSYIYIKQTSELSAVQTFNKYDIKNLNISNSPFSELQTKMEINYERHPAEKRYLSSVTSINTTARANWNIQGKENINDVNLDMNVGTPNTTGQTDPNSDFYSYYDNIFGDIKRIVNFEAVNPAKSYNLETGDIIQFTDMPVDPFGGNWNDYYMITDLQRGVGTVKIQAREVG